ncbi:MAG: 4Fe-4S double cluster binding domain-containing protein [Candidatus Nezhaarchaeales archaeon]
MSDSKLGMIGDVDWRKAGVLAGIGIYGRSGLLVTKQYGPRVRLGGVLTNAVLGYDEGVTDFKAAMEQSCGSCHKCVDVCPARALKGDGTIDKRKCMSKLFEYGFRGVAKFVESLMDADPKSRRNYVRSYAFREIWQSLITGYNYYCWECQAVCPIGE